MLNISTLFQQKNFPTKNAPNNFFFNKTFLPNQGVWEYLAWQSEQDASIDVHCFALSTILFLEACPPPPPRPDHGTHPSCSGHS